LGSLSNFETAQFLQIWQKFENMSDVPEPNPERAVSPTNDQAEADKRRRAECAERISRLLSALDGGVSTGNTEILPKECIRETTPNPDSNKSLRFLLVDRKGKIGEFKSWEDASQYRNEFRHSGASIIGVEKKPQEQGAFRDQTANQQPHATANQQPTSSGAQQSKPPAAQQSNPPAAQKSNPPAKQQFNAPAKQQPNPPANQQSNPTAAQQSNPAVGQPANPPAMIAGGLNSPNHDALHGVKNAADPGGSCPNPLPQTGALPANSTVMRIVGRIFPAADRTATLNACPQVLTNRYELLVLGNCDAPITNEVGFGNQTLTCAPPAPDFGTINIHYTSGLTKASNRA
jgi:hypothetical protein